MRVQSTHSFTPRRRRASNLVWLATLAGLVVLAGVFYRVAIVGVPSRILNAGSEWMVDDFGFTLTGQRWSRQLEDSQGILRPAGRFLILNLHIANRARRVDFEFDPDLIVVDSDDGRRFANSGRATATLSPGGRPTTVLPPGGTCDREIAFDIPPDAGNLQMRIRFGARFGELLDWLFVGNRAFAIEAE
jgi:hypothetical protein